MWFKIFYFLESSLAAAWTTPRPPHKLSCLLVSNPRLCLPLHTSWFPEMSLPVHLTPVIYLLLDHANAHLPQGIFSITSAQIYILCFMWYDFQDVLYPCYFVCIYGRTAYGRAFPFVFVKYLVDYGSPKGLQIQCRKSTPDLWSFDPFAELFLVDFSMQQDILC